MEKKLWDNCKFIGEIQKTAKTKLRCELVARDGIKYVNIRQWYFKNSDGTWKPGLEGLAVPVMVPIDGEIVNTANNLVDLINQALDQADTFAIQDPLHEVWYTPKEKK